MKLVLTVSGGTVNDARSMEPILTTFEDDPAVSSPFVGVLACAHSIGHYWLLRGTRTATFCQQIGVALAHARQHHISSAETEQITSIPIHVFPGEWIILGV